MMTLIALIVTISVLVTVHEFGHFQVARWSGVKVLRFSVGFGKPLWQKSFGKDQTEFVLAAIPLGGFVKMLDERELEAEREENPEAAQINYSETDLKRAFNRQAVWKRMLIVCAGPAANLLLAIALYWLLFMQGVTGVRPIVGEVADNSLAAQASLKTGALIQSIAGEPIKSWQDARWILLEKSLTGKAVEIETLSDNELHLHTLSFDGIDSDPEIDVMKKIGLDEPKLLYPNVVSEVFPHSAAEKAGLKINDIILSINQSPTRNWDEVVAIVKTSPTKALTFEIERDKKKISLVATPEAFQEKGQTIGHLGAGAKPVQFEQHYSPTQSLQQAVKKTWGTSIFSLKMLWHMLTGKVSVKSLSGPVSIATYAGESAKLGIKPFLEFLAWVSISIGVLNLLPIPVLDGGHLMYYIVEIVKGSPVSTKTMLAGQKIGFGLLGLLMTIAIFNDFNRLIAS